MGGALHLWLWSSSTDTSGTAVRVSVAPPPAAFVLEMFSSEAKMKLSSF